jgi:hypothetical protein
LLNDLFLGRRLPERKRKKEREREERAKRKTVEATCQTKTVSLRIFCQNVFFYNLLYSN